MIRTSGLIILKDNEKYDYVKSQLTKEFIDWNDKSHIVNHYLENEDGIIIPRFYPISENIMDRSIEGEDIKIDHHIIPRSTRQKKAIEYLCNNTNGILKLNPGSGKTVLSINAISEIKKKTLIIVHKNSLVKQWKNEFLKHTNLTEDNIGILKTTKFDDIFKKPIIIGNVQTIISGIKKPKFLYALQNSGIGISFFDEAHTTVGPEEFTKASLSINAKRIYGLTATPVRFDMSEILNYHLGDIIEIPEDENEKEFMIPTVYMFYFPFGVWSMYKNPEYYLFWGNKMQFSRYEKAMAKCNKYIKAVTSLIRKAFYEGNRNILILGKNIKTLLKLTKESGISKEKIGFFVPTAAKEDVLSVSDIYDLEKAFFDKQVVFSTYKAARDGNNRPSLNCLIMSTPCSNVEQAGGRICRLMDGKPTPIIFDLVDTEGPKVWSIHDQQRNNEFNKIGYFENMAEKRKEIYKQLKWEFKIIKL